MAVEDEVVMRLNWELEQPQQVGFAALQHPEIALVWKKDESPEGVKSSILMFLIKSKNI